MDPEQAATPTADTNEFEADVAAVSAKPIADAAMASTADDFSQDIAAVDQQKRQPITQSLYAASRMDPDRHAKVMDLADKLKLGTDIVDRNYEYFHGVQRYDDAQQGADMAVILRDRPALHEWLKNRDHMAIAQDDVPILAEIHDRLDQLFPKGQEDDRPDLPWMAGLGQHIRKTLLGNPILSEQTLTAIPALIQQSGRDLFGIAGEPGKWTPLGHLYDVTELMNQEEQEATRYKESLGQKAAKVAVGAVIDPANLVPLGAAHAAVKSLHTLDEVVKSAIGLRAASAAMGVQSGMQAAQQVAAQERPLSVSDALDVAGQAAMGYFVGKAGGLIGPLREASGMVPTVQTAVDDLVRMSVQGATMSAGSRAMSGALTQQPLPTAGELSEEAVIGGVGGGIFGLMALPGATRNAVTDLVRNTLSAHKAQADARNVAGAASMLSQSATAKRSKDRVKLFMDAVADMSGQTSAGMFYVDHQAWSDYWKSKNLDPAQVATELTGDTESMAKATAEGGKVEVPASTFLLKYHDSEHMPGLLGKLSLKPDGMTLEESNEFFKNSPQALNDIHAMIASEADVATDAVAQSRKKVYEDVKAKLGEISPQFNERSLHTLATIHANVLTNIARMASRDGAPVDPLELHNKITLTGGGNEALRRIVAAHTRVTGGDGGGSATTPELVDAIHASAVEALKDPRSQTEGETVPVSEAEKPTLAKLAQDILGRPQEIVEADVPYGAETDRTGNRIYIDPRIPRELDVNGIKVDTRKTIAVHELVENHYIREGLMYTDAHERAQFAEHSTLPPGVTPEAYEAALKPYLDEARSKYDPKKVPADIEPSQFKDEGETALIKDAIERFNTGDAGRGYAQYGVDDTYGLPLNSDGTVTVYHHTSRKSGENIESTGTLISQAEPDVYVTTRSTTDTGYGDYAVAIKVDPNQLILDDEFPDGRMDFRIHVGAKKKVKVKLAKYEQQNRGGYTPLSGGKSAIAYGPAFDGSTVVHELMHYTLDTMVDFAKQADAPESMKRDVDALLAFSGHGNIEGKAKIEAELDALFAKAEGRDFTPDEQRRVDELRAPHEKLAQAFETYFMEGKAPEPELRGVFRRMRALMIQAYKAIKSFVTIPPDVRDVFDRLVSSEDAINGAAEKLSADPLFSTPEQAGMTKDEFSAYQRRALDARDSAQEINDRKFLAAHNRKQTKAFKEEMAKAREDVAKQHSDDPVHIAVSVLQDGKMPDGSEAPAGMAGLKLDGDELRKLYTKEELAGLPGPGSANNRGRHVYGKNGVPLEIAAERLGFSSGDELIQALKQAPDLESSINKSAREQVERTRPDLMSDGKAELEAFKSLHSAKRMALMDEEAQSLAARIKKSIHPRQLIRIAAMERMDATAPDNINPQAYRVAESKAAKEAFLHAAAGRFDKALIAKQRQILNAELFRAATEAKDEARKIREFVNDFRRGSKREVIGKAGGWEWTVTAQDGTTQVFDSQDAARTASKLLPGATWERTSSYLADVDEILSGIDTRMSAAKSDAARKRLEESMKRANADGVPLDIDAATVAEAMKAPWQKMPMKDLRAINDALANIEHAARIRWKSLSAERKQRVDEYAAACIASIKENVKEKKPETFEKPGKLESFIGSNFRVADLLRRMDGHKDGGTMWQNWQLQINRAADREAEMMVDATTKMNAMIDEWGKTGMGGLGVYGLHRRRFVPEVGVSLSKFNEIMVALNWGNAGNRDRLMKGEGWTQEQCEAIIRRLDANDWKLVRGIWDHINSYWPEIEALEHRVHGVAPPKVEPTPFMTAHGEQPGGYFPITYDRRRSARKFQDPEEAGQEMMDGKGYGYAMTAHGHAKERTGPEGAPLDLSFDVVSRHLTRVIHDLSHRETVIDLNRMLNHKEFAQTVREYGGNSTFDAMKSQLLRVASGPRRDLVGFEPVLSHIRQGFNASIRAFNVTGAVLQLAGLPAAIPRMGVSNFLRAIPQAFNPAAHAEVHQLSVQMRTRNAERNNSLNEIIGRTSKGAPLRPVQAAAYMFHSVMWKIMDSHAWWAGFYKAKTAGHGDARAVEMADQLMVDTQGAMRQGDLAPAMAGGELAKVFTSNMSWANANFNLMASSIHEWLDKGGIKNPLQSAKMTADMMVYLVVAPAFYLAARQFITGQDMSDWKDPKKTGKRLGIEAAYTALSSMPLGREIANALEDGSRYEGPAGAAAIGRLFSGAQSAKSVIMSQEIKHTDVMRAIGVLGTLTGIPSTQISHMVDGYTWAQEHGKSPILPTIIGKPPKQ